MTNQWPAVTRLTIHDKNEQLVYFDSAEKANGQILSGKATQTTLTEFFKLNINNAQGTTGQALRSLLYDEIPSYFLWDSILKQ
jgi:hypothetical protein